MDGFEHAITHMRSNSVRITPQRRAIVRYLSDYPGHLKAEDIYEALVDDYPNMSVATVYNTLNMLLDYNLVRQIRTDAPSAYYDFNAEEHYHIVCKECGKIKDVFLPLFEHVESDIEEDTGYEVEKYNLEIIGLCPNCKQKSKE